MIQRRASNHSPSPIAIASLNNAALIVILRSHPDRRSAPQSDGPLLIASLLLLPLIAVPRLHLDCPFSPRSDGPPLITPTPPIFVPTVDLSRDRTASAQSLSHSQSQSQSPMVPPRLRSSDCIIAVHLLHDPMDIAQSHDFPSALPISSLPSIFPRSAVIAQSLCPARSQSQASPALSRLHPSCPFLPDLMA